MDKKLDQVIHLTQTQIQTQAQTSSRAIPQLLTELPPMQTKFFGRERELKEVEEKLKAQGQVLLVNGVGGIGKTELCKTFFRNQYKKYQHAAWLDYKESIAETAAQTFSHDRNNWFELMPGDKPQQVLEKLFLFFRGPGGSPIKNNALLIIDNIDNPDDPDLERLAKLPCGDQTQCATMQKVD